MGKFLNDFKQFAMRGNVLDMAVGVIIGGAFGKIVSSVVDDIIMPPIGWLIGGVNFSDLKFTLPTVEVIGGEKLEAATINYGNFIQTTLDFLIVAFCVFMLIKVVNKLTTKKKAEESRVYSDSLTHSHSECDRCDEGNGFRKTGGYDVYYKQHNRYSFHQLVRCSYGISWLAEEPKQFNALQFQRSSCLLPGEESQRPLYDIQPQR